MPSIPFLSAQHPDITSWHLTAASAGPWTISGYMKVRNTSLCMHLTTKRNGIGADDEPYVLSSTRSTWCVFFINIRLSSSGLTVADVTPRKEADRNVDYRSRPYSAISRSIPCRKWRWVMNPPHMQSSCQVPRRKISPLPWFLISARFYSCCIHVQSYDLFIQRSPFCLPCNPELPTYNNPHSLYSVPTVPRRFRQKELR